jgi:O-methyltransferase domain
MKNMIHDWSDENSLTILENCLTAAPGNAKVILVECVLTAGERTALRQVAGPGDAPAPRRTREGLSGTSHGCSTQRGFTLTRVVPTKSADCVIEAEKRG